MNWLLWIIVGWFTLSALASIAVIGKKREPTTPGVAVGQVVILTILIVLTVVGGGLLS